MNNTMMLLFFFKLFASYLSSIDHILLILSPLVLSNGENKVDFVQ